MIATECSDITRTPHAHSHETCRWAEPLIAMPGPSWLTQSAFAWTCVREGRPRLLDTTDVCLRCPEWTPVLKPCFDGDGRETRSIVREAR